MKKVIGKEEGGNAHQLRAARAVVGSVVCADWCLWAGLGFLWSHSTMASHPLRSDGKGTSGGQMVIGDDGGDDDGDDGG